MRNLRKRRCIHTVAMRLTDSKRKLAHGENDAWRTGNPRRKSTREKKQRKIHVKTPVQITKPPSIFRLTRTFADNDSVSRCRGVRIRHFLDASAHLLLRVPIAAVLPDTRASAPLSGDNSTRRLTVASPVRATSENAGQPLLPPQVPGPFHAPPSRRNRRAS